MTECMVCGAEIVSKIRKVTCSQECYGIYDKTRKAAYRNANKEKLRLYNKQYRKKNLEKCRASSLRSRDKFMASIEHRPDKRIDLLMRSCRLSAKRKNIAFELSSAVIMTLIKSQNEQCALTGISFDWGFGGEHRANPFAPSIDRKDSRKGYTYDNIQIVCYIVNLGKNEYPIELYDRVCRARVGILNGET